MTPKNRTLEGKNRTLGGRRVKNRRKSSDIIYVRSLIVMADLHFSLTFDFYLLMSDFLGSFQTSHSFWGDRTQKPEEEDSRSRKSLVRSA